VRRIVTICSYFAVGHEQSELCEKVEKTAKFQYSPSDKTLRLYDVVHSCIIVRVCRYSTEIFERKEYTYTCRLSLAAQ